MERRLGIISVFDKTGVTDFSQRVMKHFDLLSTGKTATLLEQTQIPVTKVSDFTGYPEILSGRVKTLHPKIMGGILGTRVLKNEMIVHGLQAIGLVVVNLYPFEEVISKQHTLQEALENIDIGGVTLLRAAAKNYPEVLVVSSPDDYNRVANALDNDTITQDLRKELAIKAFAHTANYDIAIHEYLSSEYSFPNSLFMRYHDPQPLRYGENAHQDARYYLHPEAESFFVQLHGKQVSFNNIVDFTAIAGLFSEHNAPSCAIIKHTSPCGFASASSIETAYDDAFATDNLSSFGSIMGFNREVTVSLAEKLSKIFVDGIIAPSFEEEALTILSRKKKIILCTFREYVFPSFTINHVPNGILVQSTDTYHLTESDLTTVTKKEPTSQEIQDLLFAWKVVKYVKSNASVIGIGTKTLGIGMGQTSRIAAVELALQRAGDRAQGAVMASDAFFPYRDSIDAAAKAGITAIIAPGGSIRDTESITAADEADIAMVWSGIRAFLH